MFSWAVSPRNFGAYFKLRLFPMRGFVQTPGKDQIVLLDFCWPYKRSFVCLRRKSNGECNRQNVKRAPEFPKLVCET